MFSLYMFILVFFTLLLWVIVHSTRFLPSLLVLIPIAFGIAFYAWTTYQSILGDPTTNELPETFTMISVIVDEPKHIYLWVVTEESRIPKAHQIPYTKNNHEKVDEFRTMRKKGKKVLGKKTKSKKGEILEENTFYILKNPDAFPPKNGG